MTDEPKSTLDKKLQGERRKHSRKKERCVVQLKGADFSIYTNATDISLGGAFLNTLYILQEGSLLTMSFQIADAQSLTVKGKVVRQCIASTEIPTMDQVGMAVEFVDLDSEEEEILQEIALNN